jgi:Tfp pilus assembly protein PilE
LRQLESCSLVVISVLRFTAELCYPRSVEKTKREKTRVPFVHSAFKFLFLFTRRQASQEVSQSQVWNYISPKTRKVEEEKHEKFLARECATTMNEYFTRKVWWEGEKETFAKCQVLKLEQQASKEFAVFLFN